MSKRSPKLIESFKVEDLILADWNPKKAGSEEEIAKLVKSIEEDGSAGVLAVRTNEDGKDEVIDGNHRLQAVQSMGRALVPVEHFGSITKAEAILIGHRRNHQWFDDEPFAFGLLLRDYVIDEIDIEDMAEFMPEGQDELTHLLDSLEFDWKGFEGSGSTSNPIVEGEKIMIPVDDEMKSEWEDWRRRVEFVTQDDSPEEAFRLLLLAGRDFNFMDDPEK